MRRLFKITLLCCAIAALVTTYLYNKNQNILSGHRVVVCIPVYGQSLALGEEAERITDFDSLRIKYKGRIVNENLNYHFGGYSDKLWKRLIKRLIHYNWRTYELSIYSMAKSLASDLGEDTLICVFPGGMGETSINEVNDFFYPPFINDIKNAHDMARERGWDFYVPAICWMQGESDLFDYTDTDYKKALKQFASDVNCDIKQITHQKQDVRIICYQTNLLTNAAYFRADSFKCREIAVPEAMMELVRDDTLFWASGPTYPYTFARELKHIDGISQKRLGNLAAVSALGIIRGYERFQGLVPIAFVSNGNDVQISLNVPHPPLIFDTIAVKNPGYYGFSVISPDNRNIIQSVILKDDVVILHCSELVSGCKVRYAVNGETLKSGWEKGPRGNLRDSQGDSLSVEILGKRYPLHNWCYQFEQFVEQ
jgi:hypothetical protein